MGVTRLAALVLLLGVVALSVGVGFYDWRAGLICFGASCVAVGAWKLVKE